MRTSGFSSKASAPREYNIPALSADSEDPETSEEQETESSEAENCQEETQDDMDEDEAVDAYQSFGERLTESARRKELLKSRQIKNSFKRTNKNAPSEMSSKKPVKKLRQVIPVSKNPVRDPRFDSLCGKFNQDLFQKSYPFLNLPSTGPKNELQEMKKEWRKSEMEKLSKGLKAKPYFPKHSTLKLLSKVNQYKELSDQALEKKLEKKRKKIKSRDTKRMTQVRRNQT